MMELRDATGEVHEVEVDLATITLDERPGRLWIDGRLAHCTKVGDDWWVHLDGRIRVMSVVEQGAGSGAAEGGMTAPMPGKVLEVLCAVGDAVEEGQALMVMEAMKMEHRIGASQSGTVTAIHFEASEQVEAGAVLIEIDAPDTDSEAE